MSKKLEKQELNENAVEMTEDQKNAICYRSKLLNKYFDNYNDLVKAENDYKAAHEAELKAKAEKEAALAELKEAYANYVKVLDEKNKAVSEAWQKYAEKRDEFANKYDGYRITYRSNTDTSGKKTEEISVSDVLDDINTEYGRLLSGFPTWFLK